MNKWILGARPRTLPAAIAPVVVAVAIAYPKHQVVNAILALLVALTLQIGVNYANDYSDGVKGTDEKRIGPTRLVASKLATAKSVKCAAYISFATGAVAGLVLSTRTSWIMALIGLVAIVAAWNYTGGKNPYGYKGLGEFSVFIFFGLVATLGTFYSQTGTITFKSILASISIGASACALLAVNNIRDLDNDREVSKKTLAVRLGDERARQFYSFLIFVSILTALPLTLFAAVAIIPGIGLFVDIKRRKGGELIAVLGNTGRFQLILATMLALGSILQKI